MIEIMHHKKRKEKSKSLYNKQRRQVAAIYIGTARYKENHHLFLTFLIWVEQLVVTATAEGPSPVMVASPSRDGSVARSGGRCTNCAAEASPKVGLRSDRLVATAASYNGVCVENVANQVVVTRTQEVHAVLCCHHLECF
jgi:hypothetical protein